MNWYVIRNLTGLRVEEHMYPPDNAISGPFQLPDDAVELMESMAARDKRQHKAAWGILIGLVILGIVLISR